MVDWLIDGATGLVALLALGTVGVAVLHRSRLGLTSLECVAYGVPAGIVAMSLVMLGLAVVVGRLSASLVLGCACASVVIGGALWRRRSTDPWDDGVAPRCRELRPSPQPSRQEAPVPTVPAQPAVQSPSDRWRVVTRCRAPRSVDWVLVLLFVVVAIYQAHFWSRALRFEDGSLVSSQLNVWGDWGMHLGDMTSFLRGDNLPPTHPRLAGEAMSYHYLSSFTAAAIATLGLDPVLAMTTHSFLLMLFIVVGLYSFGLRVIGQRLAASLFVPLFLLGGGYGTAALLARLNYSATEPLSVFDEQVFNRRVLRDFGFVLPNPEYVFQAQRGYLYGLPLALLTISLLLMAVRRVHEQSEAAAAAAGVLQAVPPSRAAGESARATALDLRLFASAGIAAGLIPIGHFSTVYALMLAIPAVAVLSTVVWPVRSALHVRRAFARLSLGWAAFGVTWVALTVPQVVWVYGGELGGASALRVNLGWLADDEPWWFFWFRNLGTLTILFPVAVFARGILDGVTRRFLLGFSAIFILCNVFAFLPWAWNNALFLQYWLLSVAVFVAALIGRAWSRRRTDVVAHLAMTATVLSITGLGLLVHVNHFTADDRWILVDAEGIALSERIRAETPPDAVFVTGLQYDNPIAVLSGRRLVVGYTTWLRTQGLDVAERVRDVRTIMRFEPQTPALLIKHRVDYVAIGPWERDRLQANVKEFAERYPAAIKTNRWTVFAVSARAIAPLLSDPPAEDAAGPATARVLPVSVNHVWMVPRIAPRHLPPAPRPAAETAGGSDATFAGWAGVTAQRAALSARLGPLEVVRPGLAPTRSTGSSPSSPPSGWTPTNREKAAVASASQVKAC